MHRNRKILGGLGIGILIMAFLGAILSQKLKDVSLSTSPISSIRNLTGPWAASYLASDGNILWDGGWETGNTSQWAACCHVGGKWGSSMLDIVTNPVRWGKYAVKLTLNPSRKSNARAEISASQQETGGFSGQEWFYSFSVYFPSNPDKTTGWDQWNDFTQWMDLRANCAPPLQFDVIQDSHIIFHWEMTYQQPGNCGYNIFPSKYYDTGPLVYDQWIDFTVHIKWSTDPTVGFAAVWRNGQQVVPLTHMQTLDPGGTGVYMEQAMYRPTTSGTSIIYIDGTRRHASYQGRTVHNP